MRTELLIHDPVSRSVAATIGVGVGAGTAVLGYAGFQGTSLWPWLGAVALSAVGGLGVWRVWRRAFVLTEDRIVARNTFSSLDVARHDVIGIRIVTKKFGGEPMMALEIRGHAKPFSCGVVTPRLPGLVASVEAFRRRVVEVEQHLLGAEVQSTQYRRTRPQGLAVVVSALLIVGFVIVWQVADLPDVLALVVALTIGAWLRSGITR
jgi:hypothetical protein